MPTKHSQPTDNNLHALDAVQHITDLIGSATALDELVGHLILTDPVAVSLAAASVAVKFGADPLPQPWQVTA